MIKFLNTTAAIMTGAMIASLFITHTETWKIYLVVALLCITLKNTLEE